MEWIASKEIIVTYCIAIKYLYVCMDRQMTKKWSINVAATL